MRFVLACLALVTGAAFAAPPFPQTFVDVRAEKFTNRNLDYYRNKGLGLQTVTYYRKGNREYVAGSFNHFVRPGWDGYINLNRAEYLEVATNVGANGLTRRQVSVDIYDGQPAYSVIFMPAANWPPTQSTHDVDDNGFNNFMFAVAQQGYSIIDHSSYIVNGVRQHAAIFQKDTYSRMFYGFYDKAGIEALQNQKNNEQWYIRSVDVHKGADGADVYAVILHWGADVTQAHFGMSASEFKRINAEYNKRSWYLLRVKAHGGKFSGVWSVSVLP